MAERAVVSLSGGLDSCVAVAMAQAEGFDLALLHADYGQLTERRERQAFEAIADHYAVPPQRRLIISFENLRKIGGSALTDPNIPLPEGDLHREGVPVSYVPFRNAHLLAAAVSWAEVLQELQRARRHIGKGLRASQLAQLLRVDVLQLAPVLDALTALDWAGRTSDPAQSAADDPEPRYVLLADPERTLLAPLLQRLLLDRSGSLEPLWSNAGLAQLHLSDLLQKE